MQKSGLISKPIAHAWNHYKDELKVSRRKANFKNIHALRVATQRLEAIVKISRVNVFLGQSKNEHPLGDSPSGRFEFSCFNLRS